MADNLAKRDTNAFDEAVAKAHAIYTPSMLSIYDVLVHGLSNHVAWRCPTRKLVDLYRANLSGNHLEAGVGTGHFLDRAGRREFERLVLLDINRNCLARAERQLARFKPALCEANLLAPLNLDLAPFSSVGFTYVLHCLPGRMSDKLVALDRLRPLMDPNARCCLEQPFSVGALHPTGRPAHFSTSTMRRACSITATTIFSL